MVTLCRHRLAEPSSVAVPGYVRAAVQYIDEHVKDLPTVTETALAAGVRVRALNGAFNKYVGISPRAFLIERRLQGVHRILTGEALSVSSAAHERGYVNMGVFAAAYRRRFGENPSETLARRRQG